MVAENREIILTQRPNNSKPSWNKDPVPTSMSDVGTLEIIGKTSRAVQN